MSEPASKRRKVRKGTRSCWECRRRKIKCEFTNEDDAVCFGCTQRQAQCVSQEYAPEPASAPDRRLSKRLGRLEQLMERLVSNTGAEDPSPAAQKMPTPDESPAAVTYTAEPADIFETSAAGNARHITSSLTTGTTPLNDVSLPTPPSLPIRGAARAAKKAAISKKLYDLFPSQETLYAISQQSPGAKYVTTAFYSHKDQMDGKPEPISSLAQLPDASSHPAMLAKRLLQLAICLQQMPPFFDGSTLGLRASPAETMDEWVSTLGSLVTSDDDLVGCLEGLECLVLQSFYQSDAGHLRKAWMTSRRALNLAQIMGIERRTAKPIRSCDPNFDPRRHPSPAVLWYRINCSDRYLSLILGVPIGSRNNAFLTDDDVDNEPPTDRLGKMYSVISGQISDRNELLSGSEAYVMTQSIDIEMEKATRLMDTMWWKLPDMAAASCCTSAEHCSADLSVTQIHVRHFSLLILLHLPYLLKDREQRRYEYNRATCMQASRDVMLRFLEYRNAFTTSVSGRHVDYSALVASMTLLLGYLGKPWPGYEAQRPHDRELAEKVLHKMHEMGSLNNDRLCLESAETIRQLLPILQSSASGECEQDQTLHLNVPFLGTVNINPSPSVAQCATNSHMASAGSSNGGGGLVPEVSSFLSPQANCPYISMDSMDPECSNPTQCYVTSEWPCFTADLEDWALQGVDTTYWSMVNSNRT